MAMLEVCGFHDWVVEALNACKCVQVVITQPTERRRQKTDARDARELAEKLWMHRSHLLAGERPAGLRVVEPPSELESQARRLTAARMRLTQKRTKCLNGLRRILRRRNLQHGCPTKTIWTKAAKQWMKELPLDPIDQCDLHGLMAQLEVLDRQNKALMEQMARLEPLFQAIPLLETIPGISLFSALAIACRVGRLERFRRGRSLANFFGVAPGINDSGDRKGNVGRITKQGSPVVRHALCQAVVHLIRKSAVIRKWYQGIKRRRGPGKARVAVMRRMAGVIHRMLTTGETFDSVISSTGATVRCGS